MKQIFSVVPHSPRFVYSSFVYDSCLVVVSRFAYLRFDEKLILSSPIAYCHLEVLDKSGLDIFYYFNLPRSLQEALEYFSSLLGYEEALHALEALLLARIIENASDISETSSREVALKHWDFHDLLFYAESRLGRSTRALGGTFRFLGQFDPPPAIRYHSGGVRRIKLESARSSRVSTLSFGEVLDVRKTSRGADGEPLTLEELGFFLFETSRIKEVSSASWIREYPHGGEYTRRPYPNAGARYELEVYLTVNECKGLTRGFYFYDATDHSLVELSVDDEDIERALYLAQSASGGADPPQVLVTISSRFQRNSWKYQGISLSLQLKNVGVLYAHMNLVAAALGISACALGIGDSELFSRMSRNDYFEENALGEFILGRSTRGERKL